MIFSPGHYLGRNRSIVWLAVGGLGAVAAVFFFAVGPRATWFGPLFYRQSQTTDRSAFAGAGVAELASGRLDGDGRSSAAGALGLAPTRSTNRRPAAGGQSGWADDEAGLPAARGADTHHDDAALFAALERLERRMAAAIATARESVVALEYTAPDAPPGTRRVATGVVINPRGEVLSVRIDQPPAARATGKPPVIVARDFSGRRHAVQWMAADPETGLTLLRLPPRSVRPIRSVTGGTSLGSQVFVVGNPFGMGHSVSRGHVAGLDRTLELGSRQLGGLIQVQAPLYPGDSGAAVVNLRGDWLGVIRSGLALPGPGAADGSDMSPSTPEHAADAPSGLSPSLAPTEIALGRPERGDTDFGFAIPVQDALWVAEQLRTHGRVDRAYLGVRLGPSTAGGVAAVNNNAGPELEPAALALAGTPTSLAARADGLAAIADEGAVLREVLAGTPASHAGLRPGDGIVELDGQPIRSAHDLIDRLDRIPAHASIELGVVRDRGPRRRRFSVSLSTASRPDAALALVPGAPVPAPSAASVATALLGRGATTPGSRGRVEPPRVNTETPLPPPQPNDLRLTLPRAIVERLEKLERRLEKLESFPSRPVENAAAADRQISAARNP